MKNGRLYDGNTLDEIYPTPRIVGYYTMDKTCTCGYNGGEGVKFIMIKRGFCKSEASFLFLDFAN